MQDAADKIVLQVPSLQALIGQLNEAGKCWWGGDGVELQVLGWRRRGSSGAGSAAGAAVGRVLGRSCAPFPGP